MRFFFILLLGLTGFSAQEMCKGSNFRDRLPPQARDSIAQAADKIPFGRGTLWQASKGSIVITLIGTMHTYDPRMTNVAKPLRATISAADVLLVEVGPAEKEALFDAMANNPTMSTLPDGQTLPDLLDAATWTSLANAASAHNISAARTARMQPCYLTIVLSLPPLRHDEHGQRETRTGRDFHQ